jgi:predicted transport protein
MPLFEVKAALLATVPQTNFDREKSLQKLIEANLGTVFNCRLIASEFMTGVQHGGRIDTLALSEDNNPVIIEYKKIEASELITQSLYYLSWIHDHRGDFEIAVQRTLNTAVEVDWSDVRVICIAPNYRKYDIHAVQVMGAHIELWTYRLFANGTLYLEEVLQKAYSGTATPAAPVVDSGKNPVMVAAGKKAAITRATANWTFEQHVVNKPVAVRELVLGIRDYILGLDPAVEESPKKHYVAYRISQNIVCMEVQQRRVLLYLKLNPKEIAGPPGISRDTSSIGHFGTGDLEIALQTADDLEAAKPFIEMAYQRVGG